MKRPQSSSRHLRLFENMPRIDDILAGKPCDVPKELDVLYCVAMGLAMRVDYKNFDDAWPFLQQVPGDVQTLVMKLAYKRDKSIATSAAFSQWASANADAFKRV